MLDDRPDLQKHFAAGVADSGAEGGHRGRGIKLVNLPEFLRAEMALGPVSAPRQQRVGGADCCRSFEDQPQVETIVPFQHGISKDAADLVLVVGPVIVGQHSRHVGELLRQVVSRGAVSPLQHSRHRDGVPVLEGPEPGRARIGPGAGIGEIEDIPQAQPVARTVQ